MPVPLFGKEVGARLLDKVGSGIGHPALLHQIVHLGEESRKGDRTVVQPLLHSNAKDAAQEGILLLQRGGSAIDLR